MIEVFTATERHIMGLINNFVATPVSVLSGGVAILSVSFVTVWFTYRAALILTGMISEPIMTILKDFLIKSAIISLVVVQGLYTLYVHKTLSETSISMAQDILGDADVSIFKNLDNKLHSIVIGLETLQNGEPQNNAGLISEYGEDGWQKWIFLPMAKAHDALSNTADKVTGIWDKVILFIKLIVISLGFLMFGLATFMTVVMNKVFFNLCIAVGPLFIFFAAFERTKGWFSSWLNMTLGYFFSYPMVVIVMTGIFKIFDNVFQPNASEHLTWTSVLMCLVLCMVFSVIIARVGDLASSFFGAGNIADGTALAVTATAAKSFGITKSLAQGGVDGAKMGGRGAINAYIGGKKAWDYFRKPKAEEG